MQNIYNENKYIFKLKENTIKNIIGRWKANSLRFTKYNALENRTNKNNELRLWEYNNFGGKWRIRRSGGTAESAIFRRFGHYPQKHNKKYKKKLLNNIIFIIK